MEGRLSVEAGSVGSIVDSVVVVVVVVVVVSGA